MLTEPDAVVERREIARRVGNARIVAGRSTSDQERDALLREYVATVQEFRRSPVRLGTIGQEDVAELARVLGTTPEEIQPRLQQLMATTT